MDRTQRAQPPDPARAGFVISELGADLISLQEVLRPERGDDPLEALAEALGLHVVFAATRVHKRGEIGNAILSRWPIAGVSMLDLSYNRSRSASRSRRSSTPTASSSTSSPRTSRSPTARATARCDRCSITRACPQTPTLLMGDMNAWRQCQATRELETLHEHHNHEWPASFPAASPVLALDRIYARGLKMIAIEAHDSRAARRASDHLPVVALVKLDGKGPRTERDTLGGDSPRDRTRLPAQRTAIRCVDAVPRAARRRSCTRGIRPRAGHGAACGGSLPRRRRTRARWFLPAVGRLPGQLRRERCSRSDRQPPSEIALSEVVKGAVDGAGQMYIGGPVELSTVMVLLRAKSPPARAIRVTGDIFATVDPAILLEHTGKPGAGATCACTPVMPAGVRASSRRSSRAATGSSRAKRSSPVIFADAPDELWKRLHLRHHRLRVQAPAVQRSRS
jgi:endonuclease/exonuclease/phosphatase family metal-dependent hydrolase